MSHLKITDVLGSGNSIQDNYDPEKIPFDLNEALIHREASMIRAEIDLEKIKDDPDQIICKCCGFYINVLLFNLNKQGKKFDITVKTTEFSHLGPSIPLFFQVN